MKKSMYLSAVPAIILLFACTFKSSNVLKKNQKTDYHSVRAFPRLEFKYPVDFTHASDGSDLLFVVEQEGVIKVFENKPDVTTATVFLDIKKKVQYGGEMGLLGLAFHPDYENNGYFFVNYIGGKGDNRKTVVSRYKVSANKKVADPESETILFTFDDPYSNHNGGQLAFGNDGLLYISTGDGGSWADPHNNSQNKKAYLGKMLRIDVNAKDKGHYGIPKDNPYAGNKEGFVEEIYAYGLRNPWRFSFDRTTNTLWAGDVGQNSVEEIDIIVKGANYGWKIMEANECYHGRDSKPDCNTPGLTPPVWLYKQGSDGRSVTGGYVYRGKKWPELQGKYIFGDYVSGKIFVLDYQNGKATASAVSIEGTPAISAFGEDKNKEFYICNHSDGGIYTLAKN